MPTAERRGGGAITHQSLLHSQLLSASCRLSHATADTGNAENLVCFAKLVSRRLMTLINRSPVTAI